MTVYGDPSPSLIELLRAHAVGFTWFVFLQGLEAHPMDPSAIPAAARAGASS